MITENQPDYHVGKEPAMFKLFERIAQVDSIGITIRSAANDILLSIAIKFLVSAAIPDTANAINPPFYTLIDGSAKAVARTAETVYDHKKTCYSEKGNA